MMMNSKTTPTQFPKKVKNFSNGAAPSNPQYAAEKDLKGEKPWSVYNSYYDEKTADAQWIERERSRQIEKFKK